MSVVRACIVGMGIGRPNGRAIEKNPRGSVVALCDLIPERMQDFSKEFDHDLKFYTDYREMCQDPDIDAVFVGTPNQVHVPVALEAVRNGKHVLNTKPLADAEGPAKELVATAEAAGVVNMMSLSMRFSNQIRYLKGLATDGEFGEVYYARARSVRRSGIPDWNPGFVQEGGGAFRDMGVHVLDSSWWLLGMPRPVSVLGVAGAKFGPRGQGYWDYRSVPESYSSTYAADDFGGGFILFEDGTGLQIESFWASHQKEEVNIELFGTEAGAKLKPLSVYKTVNGAPQDISIEVQEKPTAWDNIAAHWIDCILDGVPCIAPLRHGLIVQQMMEGLLRSAKLGKEVRLDVVM